MATYKITSFTNSTLTETTAHAGSLRELVNGLESLGVYHWEIIKIEMLPEVVG